MRVGIGVQQRQTIGVKAARIIAGKCCVSKVSTTEARDAVQLSRTVRNVLVVVQVG